MNLTPELREIYDAAQRLGATARSREEYVRHLLALLGSHRTQEQTAFVWSVILGVSIAGIVANGGDPHAEFKGALQGVAKVTNPGAKA